MNTTAKLQTTTASKTGPAATRALPPMPNISSRKFFRH